MENIIKKNEIVEVKIESIAFGGKGVARVGDFVIFVRGGIPEQILKVRIIKKKKNFAEAIIEQVVKQSKFFKKSPCKYFPDCGGCKHQNIDYQFQLEMKNRQVQEAVEHLGEFEDVPIEEIISSPDILGYRNRMDFSTSVKRWILKENDPETATDFAIGLHAPQRWDKVIDIEKCLLQTDDRNEIFQEIKKFVKANEIKLHNAREHEGFLKQIIIRAGVMTDEIMINFITISEKPEILKPLVKLLTAKFVNIKSIVNNITNAKNNSTIGDKEILLFGESVIHEMIGNIKYKISANSFFQTNSKGAELLFGVVKDFAQLDKNKVVWDFYSGAGSISLFVAEYSKQVYGFEIVKEAIDDAKANCTLNNIQNCDFYFANLNKFLQTEQELINSLEKPDIVIVDPPRAGLHTDFLKQMIRLNAPKIVYVSCNIATQIRDLNLLTKENYKIIKIQPVDMFPQTAHLESVALLEKY
ncbi:MAG: 23S rRNA (uracil(1939)-C(5))-methyltransferase RlmD [Candidatus Marinimicrobia bacterium]|nr:23S rRNA (uracil(1939)-C(5))-methyltransferase RlmD [Candidatus Neomarinimicrobiota bacterium]